MKVGGKFFLCRRADFLLFLFIFIFPPDVPKAKGLSYSKTKRTGNRIAIDYSDIVNFYKAFDTIQNVCENAKKVALFDSIYLSKCPTEVNKLYAKNNINSDFCIKVIEKHKDYYSSIRKNALQLINRSPEIEMIYKKLKKIYPPAKFREVKLTVSFLTFGGITTDSAIYIGADLIAMDSSSVMNDFPPQIVSDFRSSDNFLHVFAHELIHVQQKNVKPIKLLSYSIAEGSCDFIAQNLIGPTYQPPYLKYGLCHEKMLFNRFKKDMATNDIRNWLHNYSSSSRETSDLGYYMGYAICNSYFEKAIENKAARIKQIIELDYSNYNAVIWFYAKSQY